MNLICERDALIGALSFVVGRARNKLHIPVLQHVKVDAANNRLTLTATDLDTRAEASCPAEISEIGTTTVSADRLARLVDGMPKGAQISILDDADILQVMCGKSRYKLPTLPVADFPEMPGPTDAIEFSLTAADAKRLFGEPAGATPTNDSRKYLCGGHMSHRDGNIMVTCTDGTRLARLALRSDAKFDRDCIVPKSTMAEVVKLANGGDMQFRFNQNLIEIASGAVVFTSKLVDGTYPDADRVIPKENPTFIIVDQAEFSAALKRLTGLEDDNSTVDLEWKAGQPSIEMSLVGEGSGSESVACECATPDGTVAFKPNILRSILDMVKGKTIQIHTNDQNGPMRIVDPSDPGLVLIAMPCRSR